MKLVELLAKELNEWPLGLDGDPSLFLTQEGDGWLRSWDDNGELSFNGHNWSMKGAIPCEEFGMLEENLASDLSKAIITKDQWQAEREKMNKPKWIRHRGGLNPINDDVLVEVKLRSGDIQSAYASDFIWRHSDCDYSVNIMQYLIMEETEYQEIEEVIPKHMAFGYASKEEMVAQIGEECTFSQVASTAEKTNFGTITYKLEIDATEAIKEIDSLVAKWGQIESPLKWRDEIIELEAYEEEFRCEREKLIRKLESEGFKLIGHVVPVYGEQNIDMSDWRNWQADDIVRVVISNDESLPIGNEYVVKEIESSEYEDGMPVAVFMIGDSGDYIWPEDIEYQGRQVFEFVRRA